MPEAQTTLQILVAARELIADEKRWTQGAYGRDEVGTPLGAYQLSYACRCCALGACIKVAGSFGDSLIARVRLTNTLNNQAAADFNDTHTHAEVLAMFDRAIADERGREVVHG